MEDTVEQVPLVVGEQSGTDISVCAETGVTAGYTNPFVVRHSVKNTGRTNVTRDRGYASAQTEMSVPPDKRKTSQPDSGPCNSRVAENNRADISGILHSFPVFRLPVWQTEGAG